ncbi:Synaptobrevin family protein [Histomonas meleagridis]|uniref:Synaptobrevin family protein n=1 Tax=Histomonas meleagridis TaxID=135588 RepID=UPI0035599A35|nr:Synaptobrevin family protein [Histomonas meleagridis]
MPIYFIHVVRLSDSLILTSTMDDDSNASSLKTEAKRFYSQINQNSPPKNSFKMTNGTIYISVYGEFFSSCVTDPNFPPSTAFQMLDDVNASFNNEYGESVSAAEREYVFMEFHTTLDALRAQHLKISADASMGKLQSELNDVQTAMANNVKTALIREEMLSDIGDLSEKLGQGASMFASDATNLNRYYYWNTYGRPATVISVSALIYFLVSLVI